MRNFYFLQQIFSTSVSKLFDISQSSVRYAIYNLLLLIKTRDLLMYLFIPKIFIVSMLDCLLGSVDAMMNRNIGLCSLSL